MTALLDVGGADAHQAVHAVLAAQHAVGQTTFDLQGGLVQADGLRAGDQVEDLDLPALRVRIAAVHVVQHLGPVLSFQAALTGADGEDAVAVVETPGKPAFHLKGVELAVKRFKGLLHLFGEQGVLPCQLVRGTGVVEQRDCGVVRIDGVAQGACLLRHGLRALRIVPEARLRDLRVERRELGGFVIDVQEAMRIGDALGNLLDIFQFFICHSYSILPAKRPALACGALECIVSSRLRRRRVRATYPCRGTS